MTENKTYGIRLAIIYSLVWFIDLLDASTLNVALPIIAQTFHIDPTNAEWTIIGFLLSMTIGICISGWCGNNYGTKRIFLLSQLIYLGSSIGCGFAPGIASLILFRVFQGFGAGLAIPLGMSALMKAMPQSLWAKTSASMNSVTLIAPALGPIFGAYVTSLFGWPWIFFLKLPLSLFCFLLSLYWIKSEENRTKTPLDWLGFILSAFSLSGILWVFSEVGKGNGILLTAVAAISILLGWIFLRVEKSTRHPLVPLSLFGIKHFSYGNLIQSAANTIFLGANFLIALYLQKGIGLDLVTTGWILATITPGMILAQPFVGRFYNSVGPLPFIIPGLILLSLSTYAFAFTSSQTPTYILGLLVFMIGAASSMAQTANVTSIFSGLPHQYKSSGSAVYSLFKQISASFGVALSTMLLSVDSSITSFHYCFIVLGTIPAMSLYFCKHISNKKALEHIYGASEI